MSRHRIFFALFVIPLCLAAQDIDEAIRLFNAAQFERAHKIFEEIITDEKNPRIAEAYYYLGRLAIDPDSALYYYSKVTAEYPQSRYADISYLEIAKTNIARKNYKNAIITLNELLRKFPDTNLKDEVLFWLGVSYVSTDKEKEGLAILKDLRATYPTSVWSERAAAIIPTEKSEKPVQEEYYTVQVASYRNKANAEKHSRQMKDKGFEVQIVEALVKGHTYYRVWVGRFPTIDQARAFSRKLEAMGIKGNVVKGY